MKKRGSDKVTAAIVSESFTVSLDPITSQGPRLLMPLCNTPLIDYMLENLVINGIDEVFVFCYSGYSEISHHLNTAGTSTGKPWTQSKELKVRAVQCDRSAVRSLTDLFGDIVRKNVLSGTFIWIPCDALSNLRNLKEIYHAQVARQEADRTALLTMVACADGGMLRATHNRVTASARREGKAALKSGNSNADGSPPLSTPMTRYASTINFEEEVFGTQDELYEEQQHQRRFTVVTEANHPEHTGNIALGYQTWDEEKRFGVLTLDDSVLSKGRFSVRTDLVNTGVYICHPEVLSVLNAAAHEQNMSDLLRHFIDNVEVEGNKFAVTIAPSETIVGPLTSVSGYLSTSMAVLERHFHPLTRENNFADATPCYLVSRSNPTVYLFERKMAKQHQGTDTRVLSDHVGPNVVVGIHTVVPPTSTVEKTVLGRNVKMGKNVELFGSVILNDVVIGDDVKIHGSIIGSNTVIGNGTFIGNGCIIGANVQLCSSERITLEAGTRMVFNKGTGGHPATSKGRGELFVPTTTGPGALQSVPTLDSLFLQDHVADDDDEDDEGEIDSVELNFLEGITGTIEKVMGEGITTDNMMSSLKFTMLSYHRVRVELAAGVLRVVMRLVLREQLAAGVTKTSKIVKAIKSVLTKMKDVFLNLEADTQVPILEQFALAIAESGEDSPLQDGMKVEALLSFLYWEMDEEVFESQGYCAVSAKSIVEFDDYLQQLQRDGDLSEVDQAQIAGWEVVSEYVLQVRDSLKPKKKKKKKTEE